MAHLFLICVKALWSGQNQFGPKSGSPITYTRTYWNTTVCKIEEGHDLHVFVSSLQRG